MSPPAASGTAWAVRCSRMSRARHRGACSLARGPPPTGRLASTAVTASSWSRPSARPSFCTPTGPSRTARSRPPWCSPIRRSRRRDRGAASLVAVFRDGPPALELTGLTKRYDDGTLAVEDFDLTVPAGAIFRLVGPNGAGKTTVISAVCNLIRVTAGEVLVFGRPADTLEARAHVGLAEQDINLDRFLTVRETLLYHGGYFGMRDPEDRADELIDAFGLTHKRDTRAPRLSGGQRRRLLLARALMHRPRLVILDEPTAGVDFELRQELWRYIRGLHAEGTTILLTTHYLEEAEELCDEIALIRDGRLIARDNAEGLRSHFGVARLQDAYVKAMAS